jgi:hypothetical protein
LSSFKYKRDVYNTFTKEFVENGLTVLCEGSFKSLWTLLFANVTINKSKRVSGKYWTFAWIDDAKKKGNGIFNTSSTFSILLKYSFKLGYEIQTSVKHQHFIIDYVYSVAKRSKAVSIFTSIPPCIVLEIL